MPLAREQRVRLARVLTWSRMHGWVHDVYPNTWRSADGLTHIRFDSQDEELVVDLLRPSPLRCRVALIPVETPELALRVLAALGHIPTALAGPDMSPAPGVHVQRDVPDEFDGPASFTEAGQTFADLVDGQVTPEQAAEALSHLARSGLIVSAEYFNETRDMYPEDALADDLADVVVFPTAAQR
jgi:hypothetical protein